MQSGQKDSRELDMEDWSSLEEESHSELSKLNSLLFCIIT